ncbi:unnamed protein product [Clavelina lepadiformis]|uniref:Ubiquitin-like domain-containing protein n=1 Tax=Clavelina lepadiformis TaxID=159417 RepID=A0ABP0F0M1_CLALP
MEQESAQDLTKKMVTEPTGDGQNLNDASEKKNDITFNLVFKKEKLNITWDANKTIATLKSHVHDLTGVPPAMQKLMYKGLAKDDVTLSALGVTNGSKMMLVGSKLTDVISVNTKGKAESTSAGSSSSNKKEPLSKQKPHTKVIDQGVPDDAMPAYKNGHERLPDVPLFGMVNKYRSKVRLTFKLEADQLWLGTKERTEKIGMGSIKNIISQPIHGHEEYHMMALQLGPTEQSRYWIYWIPAQYINAIKELILGKFY